VSVEYLPLSYILAPTLIVIAAIHVLGPLLDVGRAWVRRLIVGVVAVVVLRYLDWRLFVTVLPAGGDALDVGWVWFCFVVEAVALFDAAILYLAFMRRTDRRKEADAHEARLRALPPECLPSVDILIATYNEPESVIEKTIVGALSIDYPNYKVWVLDDGRRAWVKALCEAKGAGYIARPDNLHAKAGNINHALRQTTGDFFAIFDADFIPQRSFLMRTIGFFEDPSIGIVQVPHTFYNHDPFQANLALRKSLPDDQRFFFEAIMPSRDGWDAAFCCGSNSVTRRAAMDAIGGAMPAGSITEDMLLSLALLKKGYVTRYLCERLAYGLAPESIKAFFVQRQRWARGAMQILFLPEGPLGHGVRFVHRLLFMPTHWLTQSVMMLMSVIAPIVFLWTGLAPMVNVTEQAVVHYMVPTILATVGGVHVFAQKEYFPLAAQTLALFQSFKILPTAVLTLTKPHGHVFKVTPKGAGAAGAEYDRPIFWAAAGLIGLTITGMVANAFPETRIVDQEALVPVVAAWGVVNIVMLLIVCMLAIQTPILRGEERFELDEQAWLRGAGGMLLPGRIRDISLSGIAAPAAGDDVQVLLSGVGGIRGTVVRAQGDFIGIRFDLPPSLERDLLIRKIFTGGLNSTDVTVSLWTATFGLLRQIVAHRQPVAAPAPTAEAAAAPAEKLPARTLVVPPRPAEATLADHATARARIAA